MWWVATTRGVPGERRVPLGGAGARLVGEHVQACADAARVERREQRRLVDHVTARGVHQDRARFHRGQELGVDEVLGLRRRRDVQAHDVGGGEQVRERGVAADARARPAGRGSAGGGRGGPGSRSASRSRCPLRHGQADRAQADDAEGAAEQPVGLAVGRLRPAARRASATLSAILRSRARINPRVSSATATALRPGTLQTNTPLRAATSVSMVLVPAPARITRASLSAASNTARSTFVLRTTSPSTPAIRPGRSAVVSAGSTEHRCPREVSSAMVWSATESANNRCMGGHPSGRRGSQSRTPGRADGWRHETHESFIWWNLGSVCCD